MFKNKSKPVMLAMLLVVISLVIAVFGYLPAAVYIGVLAVVSMQAGAREE